MLTTLAHPTPGFNGAGLELDDAGDLWTVGQAPNRAYLIDSGVPSFTDVPWLSGWRGPGPTPHLFDVILENSLVLPAHDIALEVGSFAADDHSFFVRLLRRAGFGQPTVNAVRVTSRPDQ